MKSTCLFPARFPADAACLDPGPSRSTRPSRLRFTGIALAVALSGIAATAGAQAQDKGVFRHVMPDGRVVYSDRPDEGSGQASRLIAPQIREARPVAEDNRDAADKRSPEAKAAEEISARLRGGKTTAKAASREAAPAPGASSAAQVANAAQAAPPEPALVQSLMGVLGRADLLKRFSDTCSRTLPTSMGKYQDAAEGWQRRNGDTVAQASRILDGGLRPEHGQVIAAELKRIGEREFTQVSSASLHQRIKWCDGSVDEIKAGKLDVFNNASLTRPLAAFGKT